MASLKFMFVQYDGDSAEVGRLLAETVQRILGDEDGKAAPEPAHVAGPGANHVQRELSVPQPPQASPPAPPLPARPAIRRVEPRRVACTERPGETFSLEEAAKMARLQTNSMRASLSPCAREKNGGFFRKAGLHLHWAGSEPVSAPQVQPLPAYPDIEEPVAVATTHETRPRSRGEAAPVNPMRVPVAGDPEPSRSPRYLSKSELASAAEGNGHDR